MTDINPITTALEAKLLKLPTVPGVYVYYGAAHKCLYVGKAINIKNRVKSYFNKKLSPRLTLMMKEVVDFEITTTSSNHAALLLENNLIKEYKPKYNILFRDDKTYPYIKITPHSYPRIMFYRGPRKETRDYYGPFPDSQAVRRSLDLVQKIFKVRSCTDSVFKSRTKPCLLYSINRCTAPCVGKITEKDYNEKIVSVRKLLTGKRHDLENELRAKMEQAAAQLDFEMAAQYRDHIKALAVLKNQHSVDENNLSTNDYLGVYVTPERSCVNLVSIRNGIRGGESRYFTNTRGASAEELISAFIDHYMGPDSPVIITEFPPAEIFGGQKVIRPNTKDQKYRIQEANQNAKLALELKLTNQKKLAQLTQDLKLPSLNRMECFDVSHSGGAQPVASRVVFINGEKATRFYRRYSITPERGGDDVKSIAEAVRRCYTRAVTEGTALPDLIIIDGGKTQLAAAVAALPKQLAQTMIIGFAKGRERKSGAERIILRSGKEFPLSPFSGGFHLLQEIRDEAHRFALFGHRGQRQKKTIRSIFDEIEGLGPKKKKELITTLGGIDRVKEASVAQLIKIKGISPSLAQKIYDHIH